MLTEEAAIEGNGHCGGIRVCAGFTGCVITPLTIGPVFVSETLYRYALELLPMHIAGL